MEWTTTSSSFADRGTRFHRAMHAHAMGTSAVVDDDICQEFKHACAWYDALPFDGLATILSEVAFAWDPATDTAEQLVESERDYSAGKGRLCGTADLVVWHPESESVTVYDYKTGDGSGAGPQLRMLGLMAARAYGVEHATVAALEVRASGVTEVCREDLDAFALMAIAGEVAEQLEAIPVAEPMPGSHCGELYCPARLSCPLGTAAIAEVAEVIPAESLVRRAEYRITDPIASADQAIWLVDVLRLMDAWIKAKKDAIKALVPAEGWATDDGRMLKETTAKVEALDKERALALCKELGATDEQLGGLYYRFTKSNGLRVSGGGTKPRTRRGQAA
jgi:hypothetical protein